MSIILASKSPRRQELLKLLGLEFTVHTADIDEHMDPSLPPEQEVARVSAEKARAVAKDCAEEDIIISADTIVVIDGQILGIKKMIEENRYCPDVLMQVSAVQASLNSFNKELLATHIKTCVVDDIREGKEEAVDELCELLKKTMK